MTRSLVDREPELDALTQALDASICGAEPQRGLVLGDAGAGKSALVDAFARNAEEVQGAAIAVGAGAPMSQASSYLPYRQIIECLCGFQRRRRTDVDSTPAASMPSTQAATVRALVEEAPELLGTLIPAPTPSLLRSLTLPSDLVGALATLSDPRHPREPLSDPAQVSQLLAAVLSAAAVPAPLVVIVEDLHWCDPGSVRLFVDLPLALELDPILLIATTRREIGETAAALLAPRLSALLSLLIRDGHTTVVDLDRAVNERASKFCRELLADKGLDVGVQLQEALIERTGGNPLFATGIVDRLIAEQSGSKAPPDAMELPEHLSALIDERLHALPDDAQVLLEVAAVEGSMFTPDVVCEVLGRPLIDILNTLDRVLRYQHRIVEDVSGAQPAPGPPRYRFPHGLYREHIYTTRIGPARRSELHRLIALALETKHAQDLSLVTYSELAEHYLRGGERGKASDYFGRSAEVSAAMADFDAAFHLVQRAFSELPDGHEPHSRTLLTAASTFRVRGLFEEAGRTAERGLGHQELDDLVRARLMSEQARSLYNRDEQMGDATTLLRRALVLAERSSEDRLEADLHRQLGVVLQRQGKCFEACKAYESALRYASQTRDPGVVADITNAIGVCLNLAGQFQDAVDFHAQARRIAEEANFVLRMTLFLNDSVAPSRRIGAEDAARQAATRSVELARLQGKPGAAARGLHELALCELYRPDRNFERAIKWLDDVFAVEAELKGQGPTISHAYYDRTLLELARGDQEAATDWLNRSGTYSERWSITGTSDMRSAALIGVLFSPGSESARHELSMATTSLSRVECWAWAALIDVADAIGQRSPRYDLAFLIQAYPSIRSELDFVAAALIETGALVDGSDPWVGAGNFFPDGGAWRELIDDLREVAEL